MELMWNYRKEEADVSRNMQSKHETDLLTGFYNLFSRQVFDDLQKMLSVTTATVDQSQNNAVNFPSSPFMRITVGFCIALASVGVGFYAL